MKRLDDPEVNKLRRGFAIIAALIVAGMFIKAFFLAMLIVIAYALKFIGVTLSAMWLVTLTAAAIALMTVNWKKVVDFYEGIWTSCRSYIDDLFVKKETV